MNEQQKWLTKSIFFEHDGPEKNLAIYTLKQNDHTHNGYTYPSLRNLYLDTLDPFEIEFAEKYLGSWSHWLHITQQAWFRPLVEEWREELKIKLQSKGFAAIVEKAVDKEDKDHFQAAKVLMTEGWIPKEHKGKRGPRTEDKIKKEAKEILSSKKLLEEDIDRLGISFH